jgi:hypothetical protein
VGLFAALLGCLVLYDAIAPRLWHAGVWWDVAWLACVLIPATFSLVLVALPLREARGLLPTGLAFALLAGVLTVADVDIFANLSRLAAATLLAWWFLSWFEVVSWAVLIACIIPFVDAYSVWRGPTKEILSGHAQVFDVLSFAFLIPGEHAAANLGVPDLLFFALFLGAADRFGLRVYWTWVTLVAALGATIALTVWFNLSGLPALPAVSIGFLLPNADLLWKELRRQPRLRDGAEVAVDRPPDDG